MLGGAGVGGMGGGGGGAVGRVAGGGGCGEGGSGVDVGGLGGPGILSARALVNSLLLGGGSRGGGIEEAGAGKRGGHAAFSERRGGGGGVPTKEYPNETCTRSLLEHSRRFSGGEGKLGASTIRGGLEGELGGGMGDADESRLSFRDLCPVNEGRVGGRGQGRDGGMTQTRWSAVHGRVGGVGVGGRVTSGQRLRKLFVAFDLCGSPSALRRNKF